MYSLLRPNPWVFCWAQTRAAKRNGLLVWLGQRPGFGMTAAAGTGAIVRLGKLCQILVPEGAES
jgi:phosphoenolpyruvate carboxylase